MCHTVSCVGPHLFWITVSHSENAGAPDAMLDVEDQDELLEDKLFERHAKTIHLTQNSCLEKQVMSRHAPWYVV